MRLVLTFLLLTLIFSFSANNNSFAGGGFAPGDAAITFTNTDSPDLFASSYFFDLRERETFIQLTHTDINGFSQSATAHIQIFNVGNLCNENDFFDTYTVNDTHTYNMRNIQTNDGNPSGVVLPDDAYGIVIVTAGVIAQGFNAAGFIGNLRIIDNNGYEYRTNAQTILDGTSTGGGFSQEVFYSFNFNTQGGINLSDVVGITYAIPDNEQESELFELQVLPPQAIFSPFDIDIYDLNEVPFSCRDIIFSCVNEDNPLLEEVLSIAGTANVASFEYGINNAIPHSKGGELLCPGNVVEEGIVVLRPEAYPNTEAFAVIAPQFPIFSGFVGLNNGDGRGSFDSFWYYNICIDDNCAPD